VYTSDRFEFTADTNVEQPAVVLNERIENRKQLFDAIANGLEFPDYFGKNWDAFIDCLSDLSWLDRDEAVLQHTGLPSLGEKDLKLYLESLVDAASRRSASDRPRLRVVFRQQDRRAIEEMFRAE
jgi:hypothetical protein